jgi:hypothetical protein
MLYVTSAVAESDRYTIRPDALLLAQASTAAQQNGQYWLDKGYEYRSQGKNEEALRAFRKAEALGAGSDELTFDIIDTYSEMNRYQEAYAECKKARNSENYETRVKACQYMEDLKYSQYKVLPEPYFADLSTAIGWQSIGDTAFLDAKGRIGIQQGEELPALYYLFGRVSKDNRSGIVGNFPQEYFESVATLGIGYQKKLLRDQELYFIAEAGRTKSLADVGRKDYENDFVAGFEYAWNYNIDYDCRSTDKYPNRFIYYSYGELKYYSRFDDAVYLNYEARPGIRVYETFDSTVDTYLVLSVNTNLQQSSDNYYEAGVGAMWVPDRQKDYNFTVKAVQDYFENGDSDFNFLVQFSHYINW